MIVKQDFLYSPKGANRPLHIYLPEACLHREERFPVMYFFDGHNLFSDEDATYGKSWGLKTFLEGWGKEMIVVGMECGHDGNERLSEYLPYRADPGSWFAEYEPMGETTMDWIVKEVKPFIDRNYPTIPFRECTGIAGSSMGGLMSLYAAVRYNRWFSKAGCLSSAVGCCMGPLMQDLEECAFSPDTRIYLSWGSREAGVRDPDREDRGSRTYHCNKQIALCAESRGAAVKLRCQVGGGHCEADWEKLVPEFMNFLWMT
ncbi:MAG: alpha/beta hydrolase-fold protein [Candidatus Faecousia sp.]|nr:alpha/beta hydrolase-fold protein [Candidatus Faecousia sp.]